MKSNRQKNRHLFKQIPKRKIARSKQSCVICIEPFQTRQIVKVSPCRHLFHYHCSKPWFEKNVNCPVCRMNLLQYFEEE